MNKNKNSVKSKIKKQIMEFNRRPNRAMFFCVVLFMLLFLLGLYVHGRDGTLGNLGITENQYFWILGSYVQGFAAFVGVIIASLALNTQKSFQNKINVVDINTLTFWPFFTSLLTLFLSIIGMVFYPLLNNKEVLGIQTFRK